MELVFFILFLLMDGFFWYLEARSWWTFEFYIWCTSSTESIKIIKKIVRSRSTNHVWSHGLQSRNRWWNHWSQSFPLLLLLLLLPLLLPSTTTTTNCCRRSSLKRKKLIHLYFLFHLQILSHCAPYLGGLSPFTFGLFHPSEKIRYLCVEWVHRLESHLTGQRFFQGLNTFQKLAYQRLAHTFFQSLGDQVTKDDDDDHRQNQVDLIPSFPMDANLGAHEDTYVIFGDWRDQNLPDIVCFPFAFIGLIWIKCFFNWSLVMYGL